MDDWTCASYAELCAYWNLYKHGSQKDSPSSPRILKDLEAEMAKREKEETFGKTIH